MAPRFRRCIAGFALLALGAAACGNSEGDDSTDTTVAPPDGGGDGSSSTAPPVDESERDTFVAIEGVPGVTDDSIGFAVIGTRQNNILGTCILDCYRDGIEAYFAFRNSENGIYGRDLVVSEELDDELGQNQLRSQAVVDGTTAFGAFSATLAASGWGVLDEAGVPTYTWGIHSTEAAGRSHVFPSIAPPCSECTGRGVPFAVQEAGATRVASIGYGTTENSRLCTNANVASIEEYQDDIGAEVAYVNDNLVFGLPGGLATEVTAMLDAGVDFVAACIDLNGMKELAQELARQQPLYPDLPDVTLLHPNTYNQSFVAEADGIFDGDLVAVQFRPFEADAGDSTLGDYLEWMETTGSEPTELASVGWINADLAFQGLLAAGPEFDRASVTAATNQLTAFDAGGLIVPIDWTRQHTPPTEDDPTTDYRQECTALVRVVDGTFETVAPPETPWLCWDNDDLAWADPVPTNF